VEETIDREPRTATIAEAFAAADRSRFLPHHPRTLY
jgi:hypothetical protein